MEERNSCLLGRRWQMWATHKICALCGEPIEKYLDSSIDHIVPKSKGGSDHNSNLQITHMRCNSEKGNLHPLVDRFFRFLKYKVSSFRHGKIKKNNRP